jgi:Flp pilus assembly protein TadD
MVSTRIKQMAVIAVVAGAAYPAAWARGSVTIDIPRHSQLSPVQRLNREGVEAVKKREYEKAEAIFLKAYLYDPSDPFTLNNLGYISELEGQLDRAHKFYELAAEQGCTADIDLSSAKGLEGKPMKAALENLQDLPMRVNRMNVDAMRLLSENRGFEAVALLQEALSLDPHNPFTLNNLGVANETVGDEWNALKYYHAAADEHSSEPIVVTENRSWRGRPVSQMAAASAKRVDKQMQQINPDYVRARMFDLRGVYAENQNDWSAAKEDFLRAYSFDSADAFAINNRGYVAEREGDLESAKFFYEKARKASDSTALVGLSTDGSAEGKTIFAVASDSNHKVDGALEKYSWGRHGQTGPIELTPRDNAPGQEPPAAPSSPSTPSQDKNRAAPATPAPQPPH